MISGEPIPVEKTRVKRFLLERSIKKAAFNLKHKKLVLIRFLPTS